MLIFRDIVNLAQARKVARRFLSSVPWRSRCLLNFFWFRDRCFFARLGGFAGGFDLVCHEREEHTTPGGAVQPFTWVVLRRRA